MKATCGPVTVHYYPTPTHGYNSWTVIWRTKDRRNSKRFPDHSMAEKFANDKAEELAEGHRFQITAEERASFARATDLLKPTGKPVELAASEYAAAVKDLQGASLAEAV